ncbi:glucose-6-phosphate exchanger SLC37A2 isoform X2 [Diprion similis]|uniref:glucose-6-phosphate exchanger SLC37A2 isoform X2 n=1 Tax=Diprion similis TaxID=362088 RepID=UPI001EF90295|nr:glucose-6-phosphate exchanger SLC37A2 isoform X2 [Diprion similis]
MIVTRETPCGLKGIEWLLSKFTTQNRCNRLAWYKGSILALTYLSYTCYHMSRKPMSVVKNVLSRNCSGLVPPPDISPNDTDTENWCEWPPFDRDNASALLGALDSSFLFAYAGAMFLSGFVAERVNLRYYLSLGMIFSGICCYLFGIARPYEIHSLWYFILVQALGGVFQTTGWPGVVTVVSNWFGKGKRGLIFGIWNSHTSLGNILGSLIAAEFVETDWGLSFMVPGAIMGVAGFLLFLFLAPNPVDVGCLPPEPPGYRKVDVTNSSDESSAIEDPEANHSANNEVILRTETSPMLVVNRRSSSSGEDKPIGFIGALRIPGVVEFSLCLFFAKLVSYTFLYWLPLYIASSANFSAKISADLSTLFDIGGIIGAVTAGLLSDYTGMSAVTCAGMLSLAVPMLFLYDSFGSINIGITIALLILAGILVNGPYALITTAVSAELGTHPSLGSNSRALATVTAIIDGTGSIGAAVGPLLAGLVSNWAGWHNVFYMLMISDVIALLLLSRLVYRELNLCMQRRRAA